MPRLVRPLGPNEDWPHQLFSTKVEHQYSSGRTKNKYVKGGPSGWVGGKATLALRAKYGDQARFFYCGNGMEGRGPGSVFYVDNILKPNIINVYKILCNQQKIFDASEISETRRFRALCALPSSSSGGVRGELRPLIPPPRRCPLLPLAQCFFLFFFTPFFYRGPPLYPPCHRSPYPLHRVKNKIKIKIKLDPHLFL